ncbi:MAG: hypothetical protein HY680_11885 [Chloroflexi bacterium]|nr:hypothetical protein [Chloroflexota bacterium]
MNAATRGGFYVVSNEPSGETLVYAEKGTFYFEVYGQGEWSVAVHVPESLAATQVDAGKPAFFAGNDHQVTLPFTVGMSPWRLEWTASSPLSVRLMNAATRGGFYVVSNEPSGETLVYAEKGTFYFEVYGQGEWSVWISLP